MSDDDLTPEESQVRRLLADARHDEPLPRDVADRLDRVLADLHDEPVARRTWPSAADLDAARRRRRTVRTLLVAAAVVGVVGLGSTLADDLTVSSNDAGSDSAPAQAEEEHASDNQDGVNRLDGGAYSYSAAVVLDPERFEPQVRRLLARGAADADQYERDLSSAAAPSPATGSGALDLPGVCLHKSLGAGVRIPVVYDGRDGVLVVRPASGGTRAVDLYLSCDSEPTRSVEVPAS